MADALSVSFVRQTPFPAVNARQLRVEPNNSLAGPSAQTRLSSGAHGRIGTENRREETRGIPSVLAVGGTLVQSSASAADAAAKQGDAAFRPISAAQVS
jgi:hypothetical protein